ncbi:hypothetical protein [Mesorhizobium sp.]|uniref:DUF6894 family protein n=2 Tax=Mesorhizobium TaxID=68287 RepID=UPI000FE4CF86|nr:hypothetical protein [Mesorhizobium sp.]RWD73286.1 MAG: hypothetical protein EOS37_06120 [Mesorhizobium sp.]RWE77952.1 MAG: hypothetical protein EOS42_06535 [Mesorhizobium sp.]TIW25889.1 MAG: hypothetical protein E5V81_06810 [Mesorhizobium sp.]
MVQQQLLCFALQRAQAIAAKQSDGASVVLQFNKASDMPIFHFHVDNGEFNPDDEGVDLPDLDAARQEAVRAAGEMINDSKQSFWEHMTPWIMNVTDDQNRLLFTLQFAAKVPSGQALYIPREGEAKNPLAEASG